jgi:type I restriction enzyme S subunit
MSEVAQAPQLRFPEFIGEWDVTNFGNISSIKRGASPRPISSPKWFDKDSSVGWVRISDVTKSKKYLKKTEQYLSEDGINRSRKVDKGNLIMSICATIGKPIYTNFNVCIHDGFIVFDSLSEDKGFIYYLLEKIQKKWYRYGQPGTQVNLNSDIVSSEIFSIPTKPEQQKIAAFLAAVDSKIEQLSKKQELLGEYKKGSMQQIFSQAIRFKADDGSEFPDWEEKKLGGVGRIRKGSQLNKSELTDTGDYPAINGGINPSGYTDKWNTGKNTITISEGGNSCGYINFITSKFWSGGHCYSIEELKGDVLNRFLFQYLKFNEHLIMRLRVGSGLPNIQKGEINNFKVNLPSLEEQTKIANLLSSIDSKIEQVGKQLRESKQFKKALLQQMFV